MTEQIKDFERLERERWQETALVCPARTCKDCFAIYLRVLPCEFKTCWGRFVVLQFGREA